MAANGSPKVRSARMGYPMTRPGAAGAVLALASLALTGCDRQNLFVDAMQLRVTEQHIEVRVCEPFDATAVTLQEWTDGDWVDTWRADGTVPLPAGQTLTSVTLPQMFETVTVADEPTLRPGSEVVVLLYGEGSDNLTSRFEVTGATLNGEWTDPLDVVVPECGPSRSLSPSPDRPWAAIGHFDE